MKYLDFAINLARDAGVIMREQFTIGIERDWKADHTPVTSADNAINALVLERITAEFPDHSVLAEEGSRVVEGSRYTWSCDPLDGTLPYSAGIPIATFSLALLDDGQPIIGVIFDPFSDRLFVAEKGQGATLNGAAIQVSSQNTLANAYIDIESRSLTPLMTELFNQQAKVTRMYCITCPGSLVACGAFEGVLSSRGKSWDVAALKVIVEEAGGQVTDIQGNQQRYDQENLNGTIISNGLLHPALQEMAQSHL